MMKRTFIALAMIFLCIEMHSQENSYPRVTFGAEWGYIGVIYSGYQGRPARLGIHIRQQR